MPWKVGKVIPIYADNGEVLLYAQYPDTTFRYSLPTELFHHQLEELDVNKPEDVASFMSEFGMFGNMEDEGMVNRNDVIRSLWHLGSSYIPKEWKPWETGVSLDDRDWHLDEQIHMKVGEALDTAISEQLLPSWEKGNAHDDPRIHQYMMSLKPINARCSVVMAVTPYQVVAEYVFLMIATIASDELVSHSGNWRQRLSDLEGKVGISITDITEGIVSINDDMSFIDSGLKVLNNYLNAMPPRVGYILTDVEIAVFPGSEKDLGCFENAVCLQMQEFVHNAMHDGHYICSRCGRVFAKKQSKAGRTRKPVPGTDVFCCDKCKAAMHSKKHREEVRFYKDEHEKAARQKGANNG